MLSIDGILEAFWRLCSLVDFEQVTAEADESDDESEEEGGDSEEEPEKHQEEVHG